MAIILPSINFNSLVLSTLFTLTLLIFTSTTTNGDFVQQQGITLDLIHRDSPLSPLHNPLLNKYERLRNSILRSLFRINHFIPTSPLVTPKDVEATLRSARGEYVMEVSFGTPPVLQYGIVDTGSDLIWTQCEPCVNCYRQVAPIFDPRRSSSYKILPCRSTECSYLSSEQRSCSRRGTCGYSYSYADQSHTEGDVATETLTFESSGRGNIASLPNVTIGCGHDNAGSFRPESSSLIGLGGGPLSLSSQLSSSTGGKFSYCLVPVTQEGNFTSKIYFGRKGVVSGRGVVSTPLIKGERDTFYFLTLEGISVGRERMPFHNHTKSSTSPLDDNGGTTQGNIIIDSGTTLTMLPPDLFDSLSTALDRVIQGTKVEDPSGVLQLCYEARSTRELNIPNLTAHFTGADLVLTPINTFLDVEEGVVCLAMTPADQIAIYGNIAQINYLVGYDPEERTVSFKPTDCTREV